jgi:hypothetical protein
MIMEVAVDDKLLDWVEQSALENLRAHIKSADDIKRESNTALAIIIVGASGSLAYTAKIIEYPANVNLALAFAVLTIYLFGLCAILVLKCLRVGAFPSPTNEPRNLNQSQYPLSKLRNVELQNMQGRIDTAARINVARSRWLNGIWVAATASPIVAGAAFFIPHLANLF